MSKTAVLEADPSVPDILREAGTARLVAFSRNRKQESRERLLAAAVTKLSELGYAATSVEEIVAEAGLSRVTFYRHFNSKAALVVELFERARVDAKPRFSAIKLRDFRDPVEVRAWIESLFAAGRINGRLFSVFNQAAAEEPAFIAHAHHGLDESIATLGATIPAFALDQGAPTQRRRWVEAWLLLYEILDQSNHTTIQTGVANDPLAVDILTERFVRFVNSHC